MGSRLPDAEKQGGGEGKLADPFPMDSSRGQEQVDKLMHTSTSEGRMVKARPTRSCARRRSGAQGRLHRHKPAPPDANRGAAGLGRTE
eukprot:scaffold237666_cov33-Tisochrysis_lutea.AAC.4